MCVCVCVFAWSCYLLEIIFLIPPPLVTKTDSPLQLWHLLPAFVWLCTHLKKKKIKKAGWVQQQQQLRSYRQPH